MSIVCSYQPSSRFIRENTCSDIKGVFAELSEVHAPCMSEQIFPVWTEISVNKSFVVYLHK